MRTAVKTFFAFILVVLVIGAATFYQPWSDFPPSEMNKTFLPEERVEHFRNMDKLYPADPISNAAEPYIWPGESAPLAVNYEFNGEPTSLNDFMERTNTTGFIVIKDGTIVHEQYRLGETADSLHTSWSVAKSFTSTLVGMAVDDGKIASVDDKVEKYIPELKGKAYGEATIRDVLQMSSGVDFFESYGEVGGNTALAFSDAQKITRATWILGLSINELVGDYDKKEEPGTRWEYRSSDTQVLGWLVEKVMQKRFAQVVEERLWKPLQMEHNAYWLLDGSDEGNAVTFCCLSASLRDYARFGELHRLGGQWNGQQLISKEWILEATTPDRPHVQPEAVRQFRGYQYQWWVPANHDREYFASGIWGQNIWVDEKRGIVMARTAADPNFKLNMHETVDMYRAVARQVAGF